MLLVCRLKDYCERLMFLNPVEYGRKAEEVLWRKVFYQIIQMLKHNKKLKVMGGGGKREGGLSDHHPDVYLQETLGKNGMRVFTLSRCSNMSKNSR